MAEILKPENSNGITYQQYCLDAKLAADTQIEKFYERVAVAYEHVLDSKAAAIEEELRIATETDLVDTKIKTGSYLAIKVEAEPEEEHVSHHPVNGRRSAHRGVEAMARHRRGDYTQ